MEGGKPALPHCQGAGASSKTRRGELRAQVIDKDADAVLDEVEAAIYMIAQSILAGHGFSYAVPSRAKGNQLYVPELDRIVLKDSASARPFASTSTCRKVCGPPTPPPPPSNQRDGWKETPLSAWLRNLG